MEKILNFCEISGSSVKIYEGKRKYIATGDILNNKIISFEEVDYKNKPSRANQNVEIGDVIFAKMQNTKKVIIITKENVDNIYSTGFYVIKPKKNVTSEFLFWLFNSKKFNDDKDKNCKGATQKAINNEGLNKIAINTLPTIQEQLKIVSKLDKVQEIIDIREKQIEQLDELIKSQFVEMFGDIKNDDFDNSQIKDLVDTNIIKTKKKFKKNDVIKYIDISSIDNIKNEIIGFTEYKIGDEPSRAQQCLVKGDILISTVRPNLKNIAVNDYNDENIIGSSGFCVLRPNKCELEYLLAVVKSEKFTNDMVAKTTGANYPAIHSTDILNYEIAVPPIELQNQFAKIVKQIDKQKSEIQKSLEETQKLQDSLMNKYFG